MGKTKGLFCASKETKLKPLFRKSLASYEEYGMPKGFLLDRHQKYVCKQKFSSAIGAYNRPLLMVRSAGAVKVPKSPNFLNPECLEACDMFSRVFVLLLE